MSTKPTLMRPRTNESYKEHGLSHHRCFGQGTEKWDKEVRRPLTGKHSIRDVIDIEKIFGSLWWVQGSTI